MKQNMKKFKKTLFTLTSFFTIITVPILTISCAESDYEKLYNEKPYDESKFNFPKFNSKSELGVFQYNAFTLPFTNMIGSFQARDKVDVDKLQSLLETFVELKKHPEFGISFKKLNDWETWFTFEQFQNYINLSMQDLLKRQGVWNKSYHWAVGDFSKIVLPIVNKTQKEVDFTTMVRIFDFILNIEYYNTLNKV